MEPGKRRRTDWLAWVLQAVCGAVAGLLAGYGATERHGQPTWLDDGLISFFTCGCALLMAGFASILGDRLWWGETHRTFKIDGVTSGLAGKVLSWCLIASGTALIGFSVFKHFTE